MEKDERIHELLKKYSTKEGAKCSVCGKKTVRFKKEAVALCGIHKKVRFGSGRKNYNFERY